MRLIKDTTAGNFVNNHLPPSMILFTDLFRRFIAFYQNPNCDEPKSPGTLRNYQKKFNKLYTWMEKENLTQLTAEGLTISIAKRYFRELLEQCGRNYAVRCTKIIGQVLTWGCNEEIIFSNPLQHYTLKRDNKKKIVHLTPEELHALERHTFKGAIMNHARDLFLWSCYTGMDYGDTMAVTPEFLHRNPKDNRLYIIKPRNKVGQAALIPYYSKTRGLWERYAHRLPRMSNATYNRILQEVIFCVGIEKKVSTHTGRKTFAMIKLNNEGYSMAAVSAMLGHKSIRTTEEFYAQVNIDVVSNELKRLDAA